MRLAYLLQVTSDPGFVWGDPDSYLRHGQRLVQEGAGFRFDFEAVEHGVEGRRYALPPLYPVFLSLFALLPGFPFNAQVAQALLATLGCALTFLIGREIHSARAGLAAAAIEALSLSSIIAVWSTMQETLFVPLLLFGFVLLLRARSFTGFSLAGVVFGLAALTRSMPLYYIPVAALLLWWRHGARRGALFSSGLVLGFALFTLPYSIALSRHLGSFTFIENHGGLRIADGEAIPGERPPSLVDTASVLLRDLLESPTESMSEWREAAGSILHLNGGRLLQIYLGARTRIGSLLWKAAAHLFSDVALLVMCTLAPLGLVLSRRPESAAFLAAWVLVAFGLTVLSGFGGARLRAPFEPHLVALAAVALAGEHRKPGSLALAGAALVSLAAAAALVPQLPRSFAAKGDYGVHWPLDPLPKRSPMVGRAGFNVLAADGNIEFLVRPRNPGRTTRLTVTVEGKPVEEVETDSVEHRIRQPAPGLDLVHVEIDVRDARTGEPVRALVVVPSPDGV